MRQIQIKHFLIREDNIEPTSTQLNAQWLMPMLMYLPHIQTQIADIRANVASNATLLYSNVVREFITLKGDIHIT